ncbi:RNA ligase family protein [Trichocoleus sp. DQ-U1]
MYKYPRTPHIEGSRLQPGDEDLDSVPFSAIASQYVAVEEKVDGANAAISFSSDGQILLRSRGHYLTGGEREKHFNLFKQWAYRHAGTFWEVLGDRYILYGEWLYAKHTVFYDSLPHYFLEFDVLDVEQQQFLSTQRRKELLAYQLGGSYHPSSDRFCLRLPYCMMWQNLLQLKLKRMAASPPRVMSAKGQRWRGKSSGRSTCRFINGRRLSRWCSMAVFPSGFGTNPTPNVLSLKPVKLFAATCWHCWQKLMFGVASVTTS